MMYIKYSLLLILSLSCILQSFVSCNDVEEEFVSRMNLILFEHKLGWSQISHVHGRCPAIADEDPFFFLPKALFYEPVKAENVIAKYFMAVNLLGCRYMYALIKYVDLVQHCLSYCKELRSQNQDDNTTTGASEHELCYKFVLDTTHDAVPMFNRMHGALNHFREICPYKERSHTEEFISNILGITDFTEETYQFNSYRLFVDEYGNPMSDTNKSHANKMSVFYKEFKSKLRKIKPCVFIDIPVKPYEHFKAESRAENPDSVLLDYAQKCISENWKDVKLNAYDSLGFPYIPGTVDNCLHIYN